MSSRYHSCTSPFVAELLTITVCWPQSVTVLTAAQDRNLCCRFRRSYKGGYAVGQLLDRDAADPLVTSCAPSPAILGAGKKCHQCQPHPEIHLAPAAPVALCSH